LRVVVGVVDRKNDDDDDEPIRKWFFNEDVGRVREGENTT
jgi:hypothetical protein